MKKYLQYIKESNIIELDYSSKKLKELPELPDSLQKLYCSDNKLTSLPELPESLKRLYCYKNKLTQLPELPESLKRLYCFKNKLTQLPKLPNNLNSFSCSNNPLKCLIPSKFIEQQSIPWLKEYYYPMINSYEGQKIIIDEDEANVKELIEQTNGNIVPQIKKDFSEIFKANDWGLI
jgi:Leucine-rich repeat (LRR) protein